MFLYIYFRARSLLLALAPWLGTHTQGLCAQCVPQAQGSTAARIVPESLSTAATPAPVPCNSLTPSTPTVELLGQLEKFYVNPSAEI